MTATLTSGQGLTTGSVRFPSSGDPQPTRDFARQVTDVRRGLRAASEQLERARREADGGWDGVASEAFLDHLDGRIAAIDAAVFAMTYTIDPIENLSLVILQAGSFYSHAAEAEMRLRQQGDSSNEAAIQQAIDAQHLAVRTLFDHGESAAAQLNQRTDELAQARAALVDLPQFSASDLAAGTPAVMTFWDHVMDGAVGDVLNFWNGGREDTLPVGELAVALSKSKSFADWVRLGGAIEHLPTFNNGAVGTAIANFLWRFEATSTAGFWLAWPKKATPWFRSLGIAGGVVSTGIGVADLVEQGDPVKAFNKNPAGYVADVASTAFSASTTAFMIAPNPVTAGAAVITGVVWGGAVIVDHWDEIEEWGANTADAAGELWDDGVEAVSEVGDAINETMNDAWDSAVSFFSRPRGVSLGGSWF